MRPDSPLPDRVDRYEVISLFGIGAFAAVYEALDPALDQRVALKVLGDHHSADPDRRERFVREARLLRRLGESAGGRLVSVHDIGEWNHRPFIVMEAFPDGTLADWLATHGPLVADGGEIRWLIDEIAACLRVVHAGGVTHRDVKPSNFLYRRNDRGGEDGEEGDSLVLADFGLAREVDASRLTVAGGTDHYMSPEQRSPTASVDARADIHAASVLVADVMDDAPPSATSVLRRGRAADPDDRHRDIDEWHADLRDAIDRPGRPSSRFVRRNLNRVAAVVVVTIVAAVLAVGLANRSTPTQPSIDGPRRLELGEIGVYRHDDREGADYRWEDAEGRVFGADDAGSVEIKPVDTGVYELTLIETRNGEQRTARLHITVVAP